MIFGKSDDIHEGTGMPSIYKSRKSNVQRDQKSRLLAVERIMDFIHMMQMFRNQQNRRGESYQIVGKVLSIRVHMLKFRNSCADKTLKGSNFYPR